MERIPDITEHEVDDVREIMYNRIEPEQSIIYENRHERTSDLNQTARIYPNIGPLSPTVNIPSSPPPSYDQIKTNF